MSATPPPSKTGIAIRPARPADAAGLRQLFAELGYPATPEHIEDRLAAVLAKPDHRLLVAANAGGFLVGAVHAVIIPILESDLTMQIFALVVDPGARRHGVGRRLTADAEAWGRAQGARVACLRCNIKRLEAHRFWAAAGYASTKTQYAFRKRLDG